MTIGTMSVRLCRTASCKIRPVRPFRTIRGIGILAVAALSTSGCDLPPWFVETTIPIDAIAGDNRHRIVTVVQDDRRVDRVEMEWRVSERPPVTIELAQIADDVWEADIVISNERPGDRVEFFLRARDSALQWANDPVEATDVLYAFRLNAETPPAEEGEGEPPTEGEGEGPPCPDVHEPTTKARPGGLPIPGLLRGTLCPGDSDWYRLNVPDNAGAELRVRVASAPVPDVRVEVFSDEGELVAAASVAAGSEGVLGPLPGPRAYFASLIAQPPGEPTAEYELEALLREACRADPMEPNNSPELGIAVQAGLSFSNLLACAGDDDWFVVAGEPRTVIRVSATVLRGRGRIEVGVFKDTTYQEVESEETAGGEAVVYTDPSSAGPYPVRVRTLGGADSVPYILSFAARGGPCAPCARSADCGGPQDLCLRTQQSQHCGSACTEPSDCPRGFVCRQLQCSPERFTCN